VSLAVVGVGVQVGDAAAVGPIITTPDVG
jgi:hypothetical protein